MTELNNKNVIITGASKGLGKTIAIEFEKLGCNLALIARSKNLLNEIENNFKKKDNHKFYDIDLLDDDKRKKCLEDIKQQFKNIDIIFHCLGGSFGINDSLEEMSNFIKSFKGNLGVSIDINNKFIPDMKMQGKGNIVHVSSVIGKQATASVPYVTAKSSISGYVRTMGNILANDNIVLCGVLPGAFFSENNAMSRFQHFKPDEYKQFVEKLPAKRMPLATEYIETLKLISSSKSKIFCGSMVPLDTGQGLSI